MERLPFAGDAPPVPLRLLRQPGFEFASAEADETANLVVRDAILGGEGVEVGLLDLEQRADVVCSQQTFHGVPSVFCQRAGGLLSSVAVRRKPDAEQP